MKVLILWLINGFAVLAISQNGTLSSTLQNDTLIDKIEEKSVNMTVGTLQNDTLIEKVEENIVKKKNVDVAIIVYDCVATFIVIVIVSAFKTFADIGCQVGLILLMPLLVVNVVYDMDDALFFILMSTNLIIDNHISYEIAIAGSVAAMLYSGSLSYKVDYSIVGYFGFMILSIVQIYDTFKLAVVLSNDAILIIIIAYQIYKFVIRRKLFKRNSIGTEVKIINDEIVKQNTTDIKKNITINDIKKNITINETISSIKTKMSSETLPASYIVGIIIGIVILLLIMSMLIAFVFKKLSIGKIIVGKSKNIGKMNMVTSPLYINEETKNPLNPL